MNTSKETIIRSWIFDKTSPEIEAQTVHQWMEEIGVEFCRKVQSEITVTLRDLSAAAPGNKEKDRAIGVLAKHHLDGIVENVDNLEMLQFHARKFANCRQEQDKLRDARDGSLHRVRVNTFNNLFDICFVKNTSKISKKDKEEIERNSRAAIQARKQKTEDERRAAEYAALLAEGRKNKTLQQAYANGDFIPVDNGPGSGVLKSRTGHRLGSRG